MKIYARENFNTNKAVFDRIIGKDLWIHAYVYNYRFHTDLYKWIKIQKIVTEHNIKYYDVLTRYNPTKPITDDNICRRLFRSEDIRPVYPIEILTSDELNEMTLNI